MTRKDFSPRLGTQQRQRQSVPRTQFMVNVVYFHVFPQPQHPRQQRRGVFTDVMAIGFQTVKNVVALVVGNALESELYQSIGL